MWVTELLPGGEVRTTEFPDNDANQPVEYLWTAADGWRKWIKSSSVEGGGYWRTVSGDSLIPVLDINKQQAIASLATRAGSQE